LQSAKANTFDMEELYLNISSYFLD